MATVHIRSIKGLQVALLTGCLLVVAAPGKSASITLQQSVNGYLGTSDTTLFQDYPNNSSGGFPHIFAGINKAASARRSLIKFDLVGQLPAGSTITSTTLRLYINFGREKVTFQALRRMTQPWVEGDNPLTDPNTVGQGAPAMAGDPTWLARVYPSSLWTNPGGDFQATNSAITYTQSYNTWMSLSGVNMKNDLQLWLDNPAVNFGWILIGDELGFQNANRFNSSEALANQPQLLIEYTPPSHVADWTVY